jgi:2-C-methyl-D-erythritol 4-phosphate cytidylyltransferase
MAGIDKVWAPLGVHPIVWYSLSALAPVADEVVLVVRRDQMDRARRELADHLENAQIVAGGAERQDSVACGLSALTRSTVVAIHDAARPFAPAHLLRTGADLLTAFDGAVPVQPLHDTIKRVDADGRIVATVNRAMLRAAQTPQLLRREALEAAYAAARHTGRTATDDASLLEDAGYRVAAFPGLSTNFKITTPYDLQLARLLVEKGMHLAGQGG